jgi:hypothetical protein
MRHQEIILSQFQAALAMLRQAVEKCPDTLWDSPADRSKFWQVAYHALFYTHLYLQESVQTFSPWSRHRPESEQLGQAHSAEPYERQDVLDYLAFCQAQAVEQLARLDLDAPSGFDWLPFSKLELQFYTIRHLQQHTGELMERLDTRAGVEINWITRVAA